MSGMFFETQCKRCRGLQDIAIDNT